LCYRFQKAVVSTSANISGEPTPANYSEISPEIIEAVDYVVNYKQLDMGRPKSSSIIKLSADGTVAIIRE
jgi:L-threonylcarbamoyladenylate synthase